MSDPEQNVTNTEQSIRNAAEKGAQVVVTQELFNTLYFCNEERYESFLLAESIPGKTTGRLARLCKELEIVIVACLFEKRASGVYYNSAVAIDADGTLLGTYRKMHIPDDPGFYEKFYFTPGDLGFKVFNTRFAKIGVLICWDQWFPEAARITALKGAELIVYPTAIGWALAQDVETNQLQLEAWKVMHQSHAVANGVPVLAVNRVGVEEGIRFWGNSILVDAFGQILQESKLEEEVFTGELVLGGSDFYRVHWPFLRDRRIDAYNEIGSRYLD